MPATPTTVTRRDMRRSTRLAAVPAQPVIPPGHVDAIGTVRRLRALAAAGWPLQPIARLTGVSVAELYHVRAGRPRSGDRAISVAADIAEQVEEAYDVVSSLDPARALPNTEAARLAITAATAAATHSGWTSTPYHWEGLDMDNPKVTLNNGLRHAPNAAAVRTARADELLDQVTALEGPDRLRETWRHLPTEERHHVIDALSATRTTAQVARLLGLYPRSVQRVRAQARAMEVAPELRKKVSA